MLDLIYTLFIATHGLLAIVAIPLLCLLHGVCRLAENTCEVVTKWEKRK